MNPKFVLSVALLAALGSSAVIRNPRQLVAGIPPLPTVGKLETTKAFGLTAGAFGSTQSPIEQAKQNSQRIGDEIRENARRAQEQARENAKTVRIKNGVIGEIKPKPLQSAKPALGTTRLFPFNQATQTPQPVTENSKSIAERARAKIEAAKQKARENIDRLQQQAHGSTQSLGSTALPTTTSLFPTKGLQATATLRPQTTNPIAQRAKENAQRLAQQAREKIETVKQQAQQNLEAVRKQNALLTA
ncbi:hypothetical protein M3Y98_01047200 [Aphelenchoides besseyi]|nr:hypothetical protein M3Y98_01047200 [Aphelenchoides besseyi]